MASLPPSERTLPVIELLRHTSLLERMASFETQVESCNFTLRTSMLGRRFVDLHNVQEPHSPLGTDILHLYRVVPQDTVILTEEQYRDYCIAAGKL